MYGHDPLGDGRLSLMGAKPDMVPEGCNSRGLGEILIFSTTGVSRSEGFSWVLGQPYLSFEFSDAEESRRYGEKISMASPLP